MRVKYTEEKLVEWEVISECTYNCFYCELPNVKTQKNKDVLSKFISTKLKNDTDNGFEKVFLFGGEPFLHPHIGYIISELHFHEVPFMIQTQLSDKTVDTILNLKPTFELNLSLHITEETIDKFVDNLVLLKDYNITKIDMMYSKKHCEKDYLKLLSLMRKNDINISTHLTPIADFHLTSPEAEVLLKDYNKLKNGPIKKIIKFETTSLFNEDRSMLWEKQNTGEYSNIGKPCIYKNRYKIYNSLLQEFSCHRQKNVSICEDRCFLM